MTRRWNIYLLAIVLVAALGGLNGRQAFADPEAEVGAADKKPTEEETVPQADFDNNVDIRQVAIEALVVEMNEDSMVDIGLRYSPLRRDNNHHSGNVIKGVDVNLPPSIDAVSIPAFSETENSFSLEKMSRLPGLGFNFVGLDLDPWTLSADLRLLLAEGEARVQTHPIVVSLHDRKATIETVRQVPYQDVAFNKKGDPYLKVVYENVGVQLSVKPRILDIKNRLLELEIHGVKVSSVMGFATIEQVNRPIFAEASAITQVKMKSGETLIVGELKTQREVDRESRIPFLGSIPVLGWLFKNKETVLEDTVTFFFITPHILDPDKSPIRPYDFINAVPLEFTDQ